MAGAVGCFFSLIMVGSMIAAYGGTFDVNPMPGHVAIGESGDIGRSLQADSGSFRLHLRCLLLLQLGTYRMGLTVRNLQPFHQIHRCIHHHLVYLDEQLASRLRFVGR